MDASNIPFELPRVEPLTDPIAWEQPVNGESLLNTMLFIELYTLNRAWEGLTDDEFLWEPFADFVHTINILDNYAAARRFVAPIERAHPPVEAMPL